MWEPRGHADMYGAIIVYYMIRLLQILELFLFINEGYSTGCGHAVIALTKAFRKWIDKKNEPVTKLSMDVPSGFIRSFAELKNGEITRF